VTRLDHVVIAVSDWARSNAFYRDVVGAELVQRGDGTWCYVLGDQQLNVHGPGPEVGPLARVPVVAGGSDLCLIWEGTVEQVLVHLERQGVAVEEGPVPRQARHGEGTSVYFRDPDGSLLEFIVY
jgi:catechol 2,3-dioxygenase-like lactoylglutathione lyase family enzyme